MLYQKYSMFPWVQNLRRALKLFLEVKNVKTLKTLHFLYLLVDFITSRTWLFTFIISVEVVMAYEMEEIERMKETTAEKVSMSHSYSRL